MVFLWNKCSNFSNLVDAGSVAVNCSSTSIGINRSLTCVAMTTFNCSNVTLNVNYGDGSSVAIANYQSKHQIRLVLVSNFGDARHLVLVSDIKGIPVPTSAPSQLITGTDYEYVVLNSEFLEADYALAIEFYMVTAGTVTLYVR